MPIDRTSAPPRRTQPRQTAAQKTAETQQAVSSAHARRKEGIEGMGQAAALVLLIRKQFADAQAIGMHVPAIAEEAASIADTNETWAKWLDYFSISGPYAGLVKATLPLVLQLMVNHDKLPAEAGSALGVISPKMLEEAGKAEMELAEAALVTEITRKRQEAEKLKAELNGSRT